MQNRKILRLRLLNLFSWVPDKPWLKLLFRIKNGYWMDFSNPITFCEKLQWLKVYNQNPEYTKMVDKNAVKNYVSERIGSEYIVPTLGIWDKPEDIAWDKLPNKFVLKTTNGGGSFGVWIVKDKISFDCKLFINQAYNRFPYLGKQHNKHINVFREHPYDDIPIKIIAEEYLMDEKKTGELNDYKFYCFNGEPKYCQVIRDRSTKETIDFYDMEWNHMPFVGLNPVARNGLNPVARPSNFYKMKDICRKLANKIPFTRIDLYEVNGKVFFGEITFFPASGFGTFEPSDWNVKLGDLLNCQTNMSN